jgi:phosphotransferase system enzyme I (PtsI)
MGLREFSMSASSIPYVKNIIIQHSFEEARKICEEVMQMESSEEIAAYLNNLES